MGRYVQIINGPNLQLLGRREPAIYGTATLDDIIGSVRERFGSIEIRHMQSNCEGAIIDALHGCGFDSAGAYTHTSLAIADAIAAIERPVVEVHLSNIFAREEIRHRSLIAANCAGSISGFGAESYALALQALIDYDR